MQNDTNIENGMKVYFDGDGEWYASPWDIKKTEEWVQNTFGYKEDEVELEECDLDNDGAWVTTEDEKYINKLEKCEATGKGRIGDLRQSIEISGAVDKMTSFREMLKYEGPKEEPYEIATTYY